MNMDQRSQDMELAEEAQAWFVRLMDPDCPARDREDFRAWFAADAAHARAYAEAGALWGRLGMLQDAPEIAAFAEEALRPVADARTADATAAFEPADLVFSPRPVAPARTRRRWAVPAALAATLACAAVGLQWQRPAGTTGQVYEAADAPASVVLDDGSRLHLDLATRVVVRLGRERRDLDLVAGRALFDVAHEAARPFTVHAGNGHVTALGTVFQVQRDGERVVVTLAEGAVAVTRDATAGDPARELRLTPGQQIVFSAVDDPWRSHPVDPELVTSWTKGRLVFRGTPLADAIAEVNRYSQRKLRLADPALADLPLSGTFVIGDADSAAAAIPAVLPVRISADGEDIVIQRR